MEKEVLNFSGSVEKGGRRGQPTLLPAVGKQAPKHTNSGTDANLLWDGARFVICSGDGETGRQRSFIDAIDSWLPAIDDAGIMACINREHRRRHGLPHNHQFIQEELDVNQLDPAYRLGRLFAVLERIRSAAQPGIISTGDKGEAEGGDSKQRMSAGQVRGPAQLTFSRSIEPVVAMEHSITRMAVTNEKDLEKDRTMGRKHTVPCGLYRAYGFVSVFLSKQTGFHGADTPARDFGAYPVTFDGREPGVGETADAGPGVRFTHRGCHYGPASGVATPHRHHA